jgi:hypothetical protein
VTARPARDRTVNIRTVLCRSGLSRMRRRFYVYEIRTHRLQKGPV